ncbi:unnamed protein product [Parajaminaea phylloscopi]
MSAAAPAAAGTAKYVSSSSSSSSVRSATASEAAQHAFSPPPSSSSHTTLFASPSPRIHEGSPPRSVPDRSHQTYKTRRASSGGSRIPERARADSDANGTPYRDTDVHMGDAKQQPAAAVPADQVAPSASPAPPSTANRAWLQHSDTLGSAASSPVADRRHATGTTAKPPVSGQPSPSTARPRADLITSAYQDAQPSSTPSSSSTSQDRLPPLPHLDLATYPSTDLLKVLAALLSHIATSNDAIRPPSAAQEERERNRSAANSQASAVHNLGPNFNPGGVTTAAMGALGTPSSTLCFHARNVPSISIESYLLRILKYCPTTNDVFLSLLVYFDRMSRVAAGGEPGPSLDEPAGAAAGLPTEDLVSSVDSIRSHGSAPRTVTESAHPGMQGFAVDSFNVHRLVIAGVTAASKFFSDVFYTNSRYAKVGGLPVHELNQLELQFLLLNDFKLVIPVSELQSYADQLLVYATGRGAIATQPVKELSASGAKDAAHASEGADNADGRQPRSSTRTTGPTERSGALPDTHANMTNSKNRSAAAAVQ